MLEAGCKRQYCFFDGERSTLFILTRLTPDDLSRESDQDLCNNNISLDVHVDHRA